MRKISLLAGVLGLVACDEPGPYGQHALYRLTAEHAPASAELARAYGLDLNGDNTHDDQLGSALGIMMYYGLGDVQNATDQAVAAHTVELVVDVQYDGHGSSVVNTFVGSADVYDPTSPTQPPIEGTNDGPYVKASGGDAVLDAAIAKLFVSEAHVRQALAAIQIHGGNGYTTEFQIERELRDAVPGTIYSGTSEMQRRIIARLLEME